MTPERIAAIRHLLGGWEADAIVLTNPANRRWATGFTSYATDSFSTDIVLISQNDVIILASGNNTAWAGGESPVATEIIAQSGLWPTAVVKIIDDHGWKSVAIEGDSVPYSLGQAVADGFSGTINFVSGVRDQVRVVKDPAEQANARQAALCTDQVFTEIAASGIVGKTEAEVARTITARLIEVSGGLGFDVIVASGPNAARPHHSPGDRVIQEREPIIIDMGARVNGYCGDLTRTLWFGPYDDRFESVYKAVLQSQIATKDALVAGRPAQEAALASEAALQDAGYGEYILHSVGHGVGLNIHEAPWIRKGNETLLEAGSVVTVEPGLYFPDWGGVRVEDVVILADGPCETITTAAKLMTV